MGHGKESPRQKMVGMMYLVLTALLAMNVSKSVLDAFVVVDDGLQLTNNSFVEKNNIIYDEFATRNIANAEKVGPWNSKALEVQKRAKELVTTIQKFKIDILKAGGEEDALDPTLAHHGDHGGGEHEADDHGASHDDGHGGDEHGEDLFINPTLINAKDNTDLPAVVMVTGGKAGELKSQIEEFKKYLHEMLEGLGEEEEVHKLLQDIDLILNTESEVHEEVEHTWEQMNFTHMPLIGVLTNMSMIQNKVRNVESGVIKFLFDQIDAGTFKVNALEAVVVANSSYIIKGNDYKADIFIAAMDSTSPPEVILGKLDSTFNEELQDWEYNIKEENIKEKLTVKKGKGKMVIPGASQRVGTYTYEGLIVLKSDDGDIKKPFRQTYQIAEGSVVVSPTKMNVFYLGVDNPVDISVAGVPSDKIRPKVSNGKIVGPPYIITPRRPGNCLVQVYAEVDGQNKLMESKEFRVKTVPDPVATVNGQKGGMIAKNILAIQTGVAADMENFDFDLKFRITQFTISTTSKGFVQEATSKSYRFTDEQKAIVNASTKGQRIYFQDIKAVGPDGSPRDLSTISFKIR